MSEEMAKEAVKTLTENLKGSFPAKAMREIWKEFCDAPDKAISGAVDHLCLNSNGGYLPSAQKVIERVRFESKLIAAKATKERELEWEKRKGGKDRTELDKQQTIFSRETSDAHGKHALQAIRLMLSDAPLAGKLDCFKAMDNSYPGAGWALAGMGFKKEREQRCSRCVIGSDAEFGERDAGNARKWYGCYGTADCKAVTAGAANAS